MTVAFIDLPDSERVRLRGVIEDAGGNVETYQNGGVQIAIPRPVGPFYRAMSAAGLECDAATLHYFPLGSDANWTPERLRHDGSYPGSKGFWCFGTFHVKGGAQ